MNTPMNTPLDIEDYFCDFLEEKVASKISLKGYEKDTENKNGLGFKEVYKKPKIIKGFIIPALCDGDINAETPYICFRMNELKLKKIHERYIHCLNASIFFGCYCSGLSEGKVVEDGGGYRDLWNIMEHTRQVLLNGTYFPKISIFEPSLVFKIPEEQAYPIWEGSINFDFLVNSPEWHNIYNK